jgi:hypothetical protein
VRSLRPELALGVLAAAALLAAPALTAPSPPAHRSGARSAPPPPAERFAQALEAVGQSPRRWWQSGDRVNVLVHDGELSALPELRIASAVAATAAEHACDCRIGSYRVVTDRFGPDPITVAFGRPQPVDDWRGRVDVRLLRMDGARDAAVARRARLLRRGARREHARLVVRVIERDGFRVFTYARRPATGAQASWSAPGIAS